MNKFAIITLLVSINYAIWSQNVGILRKNYFSSIFDPTINMFYDVLDSSTIRLGSINPLTGEVSYLSNREYSTGINLTGATIDPYQNHYYISSGMNLLTFSISSGDLINLAPITGPIPTSAFQNYRFNTSDSTIYGMVPINYYSSYYDSISMTIIDQLDSSSIRFGSIDPITGNYQLLSNHSYNNIYTLAGNSIDPYQMIYYYSAVDTLIGIDLYTGLPYSTVPIQLPGNAIFENIAYSCADTSIYGITRENFVTIIYDSLLMMEIYQYDSISFKLSKINPNTGEVTIISPQNIQAGGNLTGGAFIDPFTMTYFFNHGNQTVGVSMITGLVTSSVLRTYPNGEIAFDMMRSSPNCMYAEKIRENSSLSLYEPTLDTTIQLYPNPATNVLKIDSNQQINSVTIFSISGNKIFESDSSAIDVSSLPSGIYFARIKIDEGTEITRKFIKE